MRTHRDDILHRSLIDAAGQHRAEKRNRTGIERGNRRRGRSGSLRMELHSCEESEYEEVAGHAHDFTRPTRRRKAPRRHSPSLDTGTDNLDDCRFGVPWQSIAPTPLSECSAGGARSASKACHPENPKTKSVIISAEMMPPTGVIPNGAQAAKRAKRN